MLPAFTCYERAAFIMPLEMFQRISSRYFDCIGLCVKQSNKVAPHLHNSLIIRLNLWLCSVALVHWPMPLLNARREK